MKPVARPEVAAELHGFLSAYHRAILQILGEIDRSWLPNHREATESVFAMMAQDGFYVTYQPYTKRLDEQGIEPGIICLDYSDYDLNTLCQMATAGRLRVAYPDFGMPHAQILEIVPDVPIEQMRPNTYGCQIHAAIAHGLMDLVWKGVPTIPLPSIQAAPVVDYQNGVPNEVIPCRFKIWSPLVTLPEIGIQRLYDWTHAELWWLPERMNLEPAHAHNVAFRDVMAAQMAFSTEEFATRQDVRQDTGVCAAGVLRAKCDEFDRLVQEHGGNEERLHQWLNRRENHLFLDPDVAQVWSKVPFGNKVSDFVVKCADGRHKLIEIERANLRIFTKTRGERTAEFNHACQQVADWQRYIRDNVNTVRCEQGLEGIYEPRGVVIIGRTEDIDSRDAKVRWRDMKARMEHDVFTYDEVSDRTRCLATSLEQVMTRL